MGSGPEAGRWGCSRGGISWGLCWAASCSLGVQRGVPEACRKKRGRGVQSWSWAPCSARGGVVGSEGTGPGDGRHRVYFTAPRVVFPSWTVLNSTTTSCLKRGSPTRSSPTVLGWSQGAVVTGSASALYFGMGGPTMEGTRDTGCRPCGERGDRKPRVPADDRLGAHLTFHL